MPADSEDNPSIRPTDLDLIKLDDLEVDEVVYSESGAWSVMRYPRYYSLVFNIPQFKFGIFDFQKKDDLLGYLDKLNWVRNYVHYYWRAAYWRY